MSLVVIFDGKRKSVKVCNPNWLVQDVVNEAANQFSVDPTKCQFRHKTNLVTSSQLFRFSNIPNNAQVDLVYNETRSKSSAPVKVALSVQEGGSIIQNFPANLSIMGVLQALISSEQLSPDILSKNPEVIYMRTSYSGEDLDSTTLVSLGLAGQSARFMLKFDQSSNESKLLTNKHSAGEAHADTAAMEVEVINPLEGILQTVSALDGVQLSSSTVADGDFPSPGRSALIGRIEDSSVTGVTTSESSRPTTTVPAPSPFPSNPITIPAPAPGSTPAPASVPVPAPTPTQAPVAIMPVIDPVQALHKMLCSNFDGVNSPAVITLSKYLQNIISNPEERKFRTINMTNKAFIEKVGAAKGSIDYLISIGFAPVLPVAPVFSQAPAAPAPQQLQYVHASLEVLVAARAQLEAAMDRLQVPMDQRPKAVVKATSLSAASAIPVVTFDPYKPMIVRTAPQPSRPGESATERRLEQLNKRRMDLEGQPEDVQRCTQVVMPQADGSVASIQDFDLDEGLSIAALSGATGGGTAALTGRAVGGIGGGGGGGGGRAGGGEEEDDPSVRSLLAKGIMSAMRAGAAQEDAPLTTRAVRELQKAEKEKIYARSLIRVRFPDKVCLQGYFHPRDTMREVYEWLGDSLTELARDTTNVPSSSGSVSGASMTRVLPNQSGKVGLVSAASTVAAAAAAWSFELYTAPPRRVFAPLAGTTLSQLQLVPAAVINLSWRDGAAFADEVAVRVPVPRPASRTTAAAGGGGAGVATSAGAATVGGEAAGDGADDVIGVVGTGMDAGDDVNSIASVGFVGGYLAEHVLLLSDVKGDSSARPGIMGSGAGRTAFPMGERLVVKPDGSGSASSGKVGGGGTSRSVGGGGGGGVDPQADGKSSSQMPKPKWFKPSGR